MAATQKSIATYALDGSELDFTIPFEYLARKFIVVTLIGADEAPDRVLTLTTDYRFTSPNQVTLSRLWGPADGYNLIELRRYTSASERLVDFKDGSILRAYDMNTSQIQSLHIAEEARDQSSQSLLTDNSTWDARGLRIRNVASPINAEDAANRAFVDSELSRAIRTPSGETVPVLPVASSRASKVLGFDSLGRPVALIPQSGSAAELVIDLANTNDPSKGAGIIPSVVRTVGVVADMVAMNGWPLGSRIQTLGYFNVGDGGANVYTVVSKGSLTVDGGRYIATSNAAFLFRGEFIDGVVRIKQFGASISALVNDSLRFEAATAFARTIGSVKVLVGPGTLLINPYTPVNNDVLYGSGEGRTFIKFTTGTHGIKLSSKAVGVVTDRLGASKNIKLRDFTILADNVNFGIYANFGLFLDIDRVTVWNAQMCNVFIAYCFRCNFGALTYEYGKDTGLEFGNNRFGWPNIVGESPVLNHGCSMKRAGGYSNGMGILTRPATSTGSLLGASSIWGPGFVNDIGLVYNELNNGIGVVILPGMGYKLNQVYNEKNDNLATPAETRIEVYSNSTEAALGDVFTEYGGNHAIWNASNLGIDNHRGVQILGPGFFKINGLYKGTFGANPRVVPLLIFSAKGTKVELTTSYTLPANLPPESSRQYERSGAYRMYPEVTIEDAGTMTDGPHIRIYKKSDGLAVYNGTVLLTGAQTAGTRVKLGALDFLWDPNETYRIQFYGLDGYTGRVGVCLYVEVMV